MVHKTEATLFSNEEIKRVSTEKKDLTKLLCYKTNLEKVTFQTFDDLFDGFSNLRAITFSYDMDFIEKLIRKFDYAEILIGGSFFVVKDNKLNDYLGKLFATKELAEKNVIESLKKYKTMSEMLQNKKLYFKTPDYFIDHRKIYILSDDEKEITRVITSSANLSQKAWNGNQKEHFIYDDSQLAFEEYNKNFEASWENASSIPLEVKNKDKKATEKLLDDIDITEKIKQVGNLTVILPPEEESVSITKYQIDLEKCNEKNQTLFKNVAKKSKNKQIITFMGETLKIIKQNFKEYMSAKIDEKVEEYPRLTFNFYSEKAFINNIELNLEPTDEEIKKDIDEILYLFSGFNIFLGDKEKLKQKHFQLMNYLFASPFFATLRSEAYLHKPKIATRAYPMFVITSSDNANCGKTTMIKACLKMMSNCILESHKKYSKNDIIKILISPNVYAGLPFFIDEINNSVIAKTLKDIMTDVESLEREQRREQPVMVFAGNEINSSTEIIRKRAFFLPFEAELPSDVDQIEMENKGNRILENLSNAFYRAYLKRFISIIREEILYLHTETNIPEKHFLDVFDKSSSIILEILKEYGYEIPSYMRHLTYQNDYSINATYISEDFLNEIINLYKIDKSIFSINDNRITIELHNEPNNIKKMTNWTNALPNEVLDTNSKKPIVTKNKVSIILYRDIFEQLSGYSFQKTWKELLMFWK